MINDVRVYFDRYQKFDPNKWVWSPYSGSSSEQEEWNQIYRETRMRRSPDKDINPPDFTSLEKDAEQFDLLEYTFTDTFGLKWCGRKGAMKEYGPPDYEGHLYYFVKNGWNDNDEGEYEVSEFTEDNPPDPKVYFAFPKNHWGQKEWIDIKNIVKIKYHYVVENHLFKDTYIELFYNPHFEFLDFQSFLGGDNYDELVIALKQFGREDLLKSLFEQMDKHFNGLKNSEHEDERKYWPGKTAAEYFNMN